MVLHSDCNCFYASVEMCEDPSLRGRKVAVCGSTENRHGIVLTASYPAKRCGVKTGMANWQARQVCPDLVTVPPHYDLYLAYSRQVRRIYAEYTDLIEPYGMDENWLGLPGEEDVEGRGAKLAEELRRRVRDEIGITISVGVSFNKVFAKLGSDMKKPDGQTIISRRNYERLIFPLPVGDLLWVGRATEAKLLRRNVRTIGDLASIPPERLVSWFGVNGRMLWRFANGLDTSAVAPQGYATPVQSVGHGVTCTCDLTEEESVWRVFYSLAQDVGHRLRAAGFAASAVQIAVRDNELGWRQYQSPLCAPTRSPLELARAGMALFSAKYRWPLPVRALTIRGIDLVPDDGPMQTDFFSDGERREKQRHLDDAIDEVRRRFGKGAVCAASLMGGLRMADDGCEKVRMPGLMVM